MKPRCLFSVIIAVRNGAATLPRALDSLFSQTHAEWECLIQDALSEDGTADILAARPDERLNVVCEADSGVYDAWNRALDRISPASRWGMFLGADDALAAPHVLAQAARVLDRVPEDIGFAQAGLELGRGGRVRERVARSRAEIFRQFICGMPLLTPAVFFRSTLFRSARFDSSYRIAGDFAFVAERLTPDNLALLPFVASYMELGGLSSSLRFRPLLQAERKRALAECVLPRAADIVRACIETFEDTAAPLDLTRQSIS